ncbi:MULTISPECIES: hypothetical protein, partial [unclassified Bacillus (in: firmicutes)]|uniref:hypothetical protein n=1 Tax=unclassified Bacillus (in: firmicutes) TaxID=185979 RepID=UPI0008E0F7E9
MTENKQQKRLILLLTVVLVAVFLCVSCQSKKTSLKKSHDDVADVHEDKDSEKSSQSDSSKANVKNNVSTEVQKEATFVKLGQNDNNQTSNSMNNLIQPVQVSEAQEKERLEEARKQAEAAKQQADEARQQAEAAKQQ